jgi:class 3 adenylate cyclase
VPRRVQTLLFTDIVGSTDRLRDLGDAAWAALLARHHEVIRAVLAGHGGREVDTAGDGLLARFDAPAPALRAAVAAVAAVAPLGLEIRAGLHTGEVQLNGDAATGVGVHLAARVMAEAGPGQVLVSATIRELMAGSGLEFIDLGVRKLKGFPEHWRLYALDPATVRGGEAELAAHDLAVGDRRPTEVPFPGLLSVGRAADYVGHEELLGRLEEARREAAAGGCRAVLLCGEPGIGKTRTAAEVARAAFEKGAIVLYGRCDGDTGAPYQPFAEALDWYTDHVAQPVLGRHPGELSRLQPLLGARVKGLPAPGSSDLRSEEYLLLEATRSWLVELSRQQPVVLVLDDLHWATRPALLLLRHVLRAALAEGDSVRLLVLGTYRENELGHSYALAAAMANVRRLPGVEQHTLTGLSVAELAEFAAQAVGPERDDTGQLAETLHAETEGNPFFVEELLRHLIETGTARQPGMLTPALATGRPLLSISTQEINLDDIGPDETLPAEIVDVVNRGRGDLDWTVTTEADWIELEPQAGFFRLTMRPRPGDNRANVLVRDRGRGGSQTLRVSVRVRSPKETAPVLRTEPQDQPPDRKPAGVGQARARRRRWVPVAAVLLVAAIGVLGVWVYRPRVREASPRSREASTSSVSSLDLLVADFRPLDFTPLKQPEKIDLASLSTSGSFNDTHKRWLRDAGLRRALVVKFTHRKGGRILELRIYEVRGSDEARTLQEKLSICSTIGGTKTFRAPGVSGSKGTECDLREGRTQEVTFTRGPRLFKVKLWGRAPPSSRELILKLAHAEAAVAR